jgi:hypothetical protein
MGEIVAAKERISEIVSRRIGYKASRKKHRITIAKKAMLANRDNFVGKTPVRLNFW